MKTSINHRSQKSQICFDNKLIINVTRTYINAQIRVIKTLCNSIVLASTKFHKYELE